MEKAKNFIVPTDFSATALNAYHYALHLAEAMDATVTVVHVNEYILPGAVLSAISELEVGRLTEVSMEVFISEEETEDDFPMTKTAVRTKILKGDPVGELVGMSRSGDDNMIVLGTTGLQDYFSKIIGSKSLQIANKAHCPVILVPRDAQWRQIDRIMFASNYDNSTPSMIDRITRFAGIFNAKVHYVNVHENKSDSQEEQDGISWDMLFPATQTGYPFEVHSIESGETVSELKEFAETNQIDLMAFISEHRSFWKNLIHKSITKTISIASDIPMMVFHADDIR